MVWSGVLLLMLHFVSDFEKVLSHKVHKESHGVHTESTQSPQGVHLESMWSLHGVHMESTGSPQGIWDSRWTPGGVHCNLWGSVTYSQNQGTRTKQQIQKARQRPRASSDKNRHRAPRLENNQGIHRGRDLGMTDQVKKMDRGR